MTDKITTIIVDDEPLARKGLSVRLAGIDCIELIAECSSGREAVEKVRALKPKLLFLDIQMPGLNGFQVLEELGKLGQEMPVCIFVTAFDQYAIKAFDVHALDYLLKPVDEKRLNEAVEAAAEFIEKEKEGEHKTKLVKLVSEVTGNDCSDILEKLASGEPITTSPYPDILAIKDAGEITRVPIGDVQWIDAAGDYMCVHCPGDTHIMRKTMKELEGILDPKKFIRVHRSVIVNIKRIEKMVSHVSGEYHLLLDNGKELKVSRSYRDKVKSIMTQ